MPVTGLESYIVVKVDEVDLSKRIAHCLDKTRSHIQCLFRDSSGGSLTIPNQGDYWTAKKIGMTWHLEHRLDSPEEHDWAIDNMQPGDTRLRGDRVLAPQGISIGHSDTGAVSSTIFSCTGIPSNTLGSNGDFCLRHDGGAMTTIYHKRSGSWVGIV